jgi:hypothetical protein
VGATSNAAINITGSGQFALHLRQRGSAAAPGSAITANGADDTLLQLYPQPDLPTMVRRRLDPAVLAQRQAPRSDSTEIPGSDVPKSTSVGDASYFYSSANYFSNNQLNASADRRLPPIASLKRLHDGRECWLDRDDTRWSFRGAAPIPQ